jgi:hypothetical protein
VTTSTSTLTPTSDQSQPLFPQPTGSRRRWHSPSQEPSARENIINLPHDSLCPLDACSNQLVSARTTLWSSEQVVCRLHVQARKNCCHDSDHAFSALVHGRSIAYSPFVRYATWSQQFRPSERGIQRVSPDEDVPAAMVTKAGNRG